MKTPEKYAKELIEKYYKLDCLYNSPVYGINLLAIQCAIIDVENTIEAIQSLTISGINWTTNGLDILDFYKEVLTILKTK